MKRIQWILIVGLLVSLGVPRTSLGQISSTARCRLRERRRAHPQENKTQSCSATVPYGVGAIASRKYLLPLLRVASKMCCRLDLGRVPERGKSPQCVSVAHFSSD